MTYTKTTWVDGSTPLNSANMTKIENELALLDGPNFGPAIPVSTTIPGSPVDGQEVILVSSLTAPVWAWHMRYLAASTYTEKWFFLGGSPLQNYYAASQAQPGAWASFNPGVTVPFSGGYNFVGQAVYGNTGAGLLGLSGWYSGGYDIDWQVLLQAAAGTNNLSTTGSAKIFSAGTAITLAGYTNIASSISNAFISILPTRLA